MRRGLCFAIVDFLMRGVRGWRGGDEGGGGDEDEDERGGGWRWG